MNAQIRCDVCFEAYSLDMFRFLPTCGHGLCIVCSEKTLTKRNCVICRHPKGSQESVQIFLTFAEADSNRPVDKARVVVENLAKIGPDSMPLSVQKAGRKIRHVLRDIEPGDDIARELLDAAKNLDERIYPLFLEFDLANDKIASLTAQIEELRQRLKVAESREDEIKRLRRSLADANDKSNQAVALAKEVKAAVLKQQGENARLSRTVQRQLSELSSKEEDNEVLRAKLTRRDNRISLLEKKLKILSRKTRHLDPTPDVGAIDNDPDESLQIENSAEGIRVPRKSTDWLPVEPERPVGGVIREKHKDQDSKSESILSATRFETDPAWS
ncbi:Proteophosphoglycan ppg4 [Mycena venus]|uniref:Proteophosphoglycan ppg4 n=1 Tax=Mycena venus TaxID=2733690 RepID=A0A8H7CX62_9AGAR|nr:Proteophosphoglycan ppg4 [Mycena venus]